jgi:hypothetical protein
LLGEPSRISDIQGSTAGKEGKVMDYGKVMENLRQPEATLLLNSFDISALTQTMQDLKGRWGDEEELKKLQIVVANDSRYFSVGEVGELLNRVGIDPLVYNVRIVEQSVGKNGQMKLQDLLMKNKGLFEGRSLFLLNGHNLWSFEGLVGNMLKSLLTIMFEPKDLKQMEKWKESLHLNPEEWRSFKEGFKNHLMSDLFEANRREIQVINVQQ